MKADEIRAMAADNRLPQHDLGVNSGLIVEVLKEMTAQLAELNDFIRESRDWLCNGGCIDVRNHN